MKITTGIDIIEVDRIKKAIEEAEDKFLNKIYTQIEIDYCNKSNIMKYQHFAARFAVKEAVFKAISEYVNKEKDSFWKDIEVIKDKCGKPKINVDKLMKIIDKTANIDIKSIDISISHVKEYAVASAVILFE